MTLKVDEVVGAYMKLRNQKAQLEAATKEKVAELKERMGKIEAWLLREADKQGVTSFKTNAGTAYVTTVDFAQVADWDEVLKFVRTHAAYDMLERRVNKTAVRGYMEANNKVPPGVNYGTRMEVNVRKPSNKVED